MQLTLQTSRRLILDYPCMSSLITQIFKSYKTSLAKKRRNAEREREMRWIKNSERFDFLLLFLMLDEGKVNRGM